MIRNPHVHILSVWGDNLPL